MSVAYLLPNPELETSTTTANTLGLGGLRALDGRAFPLTRVKVRASLAGPCAHTVVEQHFANPFDEILDVTWIFPLPTDGVLVALELRAGDIVVTGECQERGQARAAFDAARGEGKRTALVEKEQGNVHTLSLAGLPARGEVTVRLTLVELLPSIDGRFRWQFPTTIAPRYTPGDTVGHSGHGISPDTDAVPDASRLSPPLRLQGGTTLDLEVEVAGPVSALESSLHAVKLSLDAGGVRVAPSTNATLDKDFILEFSTATHTTPVTRAWTDGTHTLVVLEPPSDTAAETLPRDAVFAIDISGSMEGTKIEAAKTALRGALHGLRTGDRFKLIAFDDRLEHFSNDFALYDDRTLRAADTWIDALEARGGTEMLPAIQESLAGSTPNGRLRTVLLVTDGQSTDEARLLPAVANRKGAAIVFTLGIDTAVNDALLMSIARVGGGACELCTPDDDIDAVVARLEARFGSALLSQLTVAGAARPDGQTVFAGRPAMLLLENAPSTVEVTGTGPEGAFTATVVPTPLAFPLGALWAMERVAWLEERLTLRPFEEEAIRPEILRVALQWQIASKFTAFVCVDHSHTTSGERRHVVQPTELPERWEIDASLAEGSPGSAYGGGMARRAHMSSPSQMPYMSSGAFEADPESAPDMPYAPSPPLFSAPRPASPAPAASRMRAALDGVLGGKKKQRRHTGTQSIDAPAEARPYDVAGELARSQRADGSFGGDVGRTAAALLALLLLGSTRRKGDRRRTVQKAAEWLKLHAEDERATFALATLVEAELSGVVADAAWRRLVAESPEGGLVERLLEARNL